MAERAALFGPWRQDVDEGERAAHRRMRARIAECAGAAPRATRIKTFDFRPRNQTAMYCRERE